MRARCLLALLAAGCLAAPPDPRAADGDGGADGDVGHADGGDDGLAGCPAGSRLDLVWVSEVSFDHGAQNQVTLPGLMVLVNPGPDPVVLGALSVLPPDEAGPVTAEFSLTGQDLIVPPGEAMGAVNIGAAGVMTDEFDEAWTDLALPELDLVLGFDGAAADAEVPLRLQLGGYAFDLSVLVRHDPIASQLHWAVDAGRASARCE